MGKEVLAGAVLDLHLQAGEQPDLDATMASLRATALRVKDERDMAIRLLRRTLDIREMGNDGPHKSDIRAFLARIGEPVAVSRGTRQQALEREIVAFNPDTTEAVELLASFTRALIDRYGKPRTMDLQKCANDVEEALGEIETGLLRDGSSL